MKNNFVEGVFTALVTPFSDGQVDFESFDSLLEFQYENGVKDFVVNGTTAESPTLSWSEVEALFKAVKNKFADSKIILGTGSNSTMGTIETTKKAKDLGADGALVVCPYYNKPPQRGIYQHYVKVAESVDIPLVMYNVPGRTITEIEHETTLSLTEIKNIVATKEACGNVAKDKALLDKLPKDFSAVSGDDGTCIDFCANGGSGVISVMSHVLPEQTARWIKQARSGEEKAAHNEFSKYEKLINLLYVEANPIPVKMALKLMGIIQSAEMRLPLVELAGEHTEKIKDELKLLGM